jgi:cell division GTPase FtsZ
MMMNAFQPASGAGLPMSESRVAADTRHRVSYPNSRPRAIKVFGLGQGGSEIARRLGDAGFGHVEALPTLGEGGAGPALDRNALQRVVETADMVFVVARDGDDIGLASVLSPIAHARNILVTGILIQALEARTPSPDATLNALRSASDMLVIVSDEAYVGERLGALGA